MKMKTWMFVVAATTIMGAVTLPTTADAQVYVREGVRYCFYPDGWQGPGWYRCGYRWRQGLGWGGAYDWGVSFGWHHRGWERRHGHHHARDRYRGRQQSTQGVAPIRGTSRPIGSSVSPTTSQPAGTSIRGGTTTGSGAPMGGTSAAPSGGNVGGGVNVGGGSGGAPMTGGKQR